LKRFDLIWRDFTNSEFYTPEILVKLQNIDIKETYYLNTNFNKLNSYEVTYICFEIAITRSIEYSIRNLINAFNVVNPKHTIPLKSQLNDSTIKLINEYKDSTEIYILLELTQMHHYFNHSPLFNPHKKVWIRPKIVDHIISKFYNQ